MEPVPETERLEQFNSNPASSSLRLTNPASVSTIDLDTTRRTAPAVVRRSTDPVPSAPSSPLWSQPVVLPYRPRTTSPLAGAHTRSRSTASLGPSMSRTRSMPGVSGSGHLLISPNARPTSPTGSPARVRAPRKPVDDVFPSSPVRTSVLDHDRSPSRYGPVLETTSSPNLSTGTFSRQIRRPSSPLRHASSSSLSALPTTPSSSVASSPNLRSYDSFPGYMASLPSTPTSTRSRSPSISSLETIPDSPDAEEAALEAERIAQLKAAAEAAEGGETKTRGSLDVPPSRGRTLGLSSRDKRKRWSVCGAERRGDLDLETIWED